MFLSKLEKYMITGEKYNSIVKEKTTHNIKQNISEYTDPVWVFCLMLGKVNSIDNNFSALMDIKIKIIEHFKKNPKLLKKYKISNIENDVLYSKNKYHTILFLFSIYYNINLIYVSNNIYYSFFYNEDKPDLIYLIKNNNNIVTHFTNPSTNTVEEIKKTKLHINNINKPINSLSSYKLNDLIEISNKLSIKTYDNNGKKRTKQKLYEDIIIKLIKQ